MPNAARFTDKVVFVTGAASGIGRAAAVAFAAEGARGVFLRRMEGLAAAEAVPKTVMIDPTYLKAHRTAPGLRVKKGISAA